MTEPDFSAGNPGWRLIAAGMGAYGQSTLTFAWPAPYPAPVEEQQ